MTTYHPLDYIEISVSDVGRAKAFYTAAFGWEFEDYGPEYAAIRAPGGTEDLGGLTVGPVTAGGVLPLVRSGDLDASLTALTAAGGAVAEEPYGYPGGRRFIAKDPDGNVVGVYQPAG